MMHYMLLTSPGPPTKKSLSKPDPRPVLVLTWSLHEKVPQHRILDHGGRNVSFLTWSPHEKVPQNRILDHGGRNVSFLTWSPHEKVPQNRILDHGRRNLAFQRSALQGIFLFPSIATSLAICARRDAGVVVRVNSVIEPDLNWKKFFAEFFLSLFSKKCIFCDNFP
jgi:hypothetical protein